MRYYTVYFDQTKQRIGLSGNLMNYTQYLNNDNLILFINVWMILVGILVASTIFCKINKNPQISKPLVVDF